MKKEHTYDILFGLCIVLFVGLLMNTPTAPSKVSLIVEEYCDAAKEDIPVVVDTTFNYVFNRFHVFNKNLDTATVEKFLEVAEHFQMDTTNELLEWSVGQILLESGAKQHYADSSLVVSYAGAVGMTQIMPATGLGYLRKKIGKSGESELLKLGATDFSFAYSDTLSKSEKKILTSHWLSIEANNIILWGYIMSGYVAKKGDIQKALIAYNAGWGGLNYYLRLGNKTSSHKYIKGIKRNYT